MLREIYSAARAVYTKEMAVQDSDSTPAGRGKFYMAAQAVLVAVQTAIRKRRYRLELARQRVIAEISLRRELKLLAKDTSKSANEQEAAAKVLADKVDSVFASLCDDANKLADTNKRVRSLIQGITTTCDSNAELANNILMDLQSTLEEVLAIRSQLSCAAVDEAQAKIKEFVSQFGLEVEVLVRESGLVSQDNEDAGSQKRSARHRRYLHSRYSTLGKGTSKDTKDTSSVECPLADGKLSSLHEGDQDSMAGDTRWAQPSGLLKRRLQGMKALKEDSADASKIRSWNNMVLPSVPGLDFPGIASNLHLPVPTTATGSEPKPRSRPSSEGRRFSDAPLPRQQDQSSPSSSPRQQSPGSPGGRVLRRAVVEASEAPGRKPSKSKSPLPLHLVELEVPELASGDVSALPSFNTNSIQRHVSRLACSRTLKAVEAKLAYQDESEQDPGNASPDEDLGGWSTDSVTFRDIRVVPPSEERLSSPPPSYRGRIISRRISEGSQQNPLLGIQSTGISSPCEGSRGLQNPSFRIKTRRISSPCEGSRSPRDPSFGGGVPFPCITPPGEERRSPQPPPYRGRILQTQPKLPSGVDGRGPLLFSS
eukprot:TRINITY_DN4809_c0_g1_i1.p1 TRINITY_DN4809_c0_g1~~TRINITY_DN4809_c0_g1_i1.p1  ORF type:complete len:682 (+),score=75.48 TRINITY_DN4809_c0_g1_i1:264-2048(+)